MAKSRKIRRPLRRRGSLALIAMFLFCSAAMRLGIGVNQAMAKAPAAGEDLITETLAVNCEPPKDIAMVLKALKKREDRLAVNEESLKDRMQALAVADTVVDRKMAELIAAEERLQQSISQAEVASENDISKLTAVYESMKPAEAAALFEEMDPDFAAGFLSRMRPEAAAGVMAGLTPTSAYTISVVLAGRNANVPKE